MMTQTGTLPYHVVRAAAEAAVRAIPPVWPLASSVAVNPFLGQTSGRLAAAGALLERVGGIDVTMARSWYAAKIARGDISDADIEDALASAPPNLRPADVNAVKSEVERPRAMPQRIPTVADLAAGVTGTDWPSLCEERFGAWAAGYFDEAQALWAAPRRGGAYAVWRAGAVHDLTPEIAGLRGFAQFVADAPQSADDAIVDVTRRLGLTREALQTYYHALLISLGGWAQVARQRLWQAELAGEDDTTAIEFLAIRLVFEDALLRHSAGKIDAAWRNAAAAHAAPVVPTADHVLAEVLQDASERASQRELATVLAAPAPPRAEARPALQAVFCIDVRSEVFRRALEAVDPAIATLGFAGFFGLGTSHRAFASDVAERRLPVLLNPAVQSRAGTDADADRDTSARYLARARRAWGRFKMAAVSSFSFVEAMGPVYVVRLLRDALALSRRGAPNDPAPELHPALGLGFGLNQIQKATSIASATAERKFRASLS